MNHLLQNASAASGLRPLDPIGLLGVPSYILRNFASSLLTKPAKNPRFAKLIRVLASTVAAMVAACVYLALAGDRLYSLWSTFSCRFMRTVQIDDNDKLCPALMGWVRDRTDQSKVQRICGETRSSARRSKRILRCGDKADGNICYTEDEGTQYFWHGWRLFSVGVLRKKEGYFWTRKYAVSTFGFSNQPIKHLLEEALEAYTKNHASKHTRILNVEDGNWTWLAERPVRPLDTIDLDDAVKETLVKDLQSYLLPDAEARYISHGIPYRRGYLLYGPPGTGKTSLSLAIAGHFDIDLYVMSLADPGLTDAKLAKLFGSLPKPSVLLLEDIDSAGLEREVAGTPHSPLDWREYGPANSGNPTAAMNPFTGGKPKMTRITLSGLLNALDGVAAPDGCITIMTTNNPENLDSALTRPGRVDCKLAFQYINEDTARKMFSRLFSEAKGHDIEELSHKFASKLPDRLVSPAELQGYLLEHIGLPELAVSELEPWVQKKLLENYAKSGESLKAKFGEKVDGVDSIRSNDGSSSVDYTTIQYSSSMQWLKMQTMRAYSALTMSTASVTKQGR